MVFVASRQCPSHNTTSSKQIIYPLIYVDHTHYGGCYDHFEYVHIEGSRGLVVELLKLTNK